MDIKVGDRITYKNLGKIITTLIINTDDIEAMKRISKKIEILKIERPIYEVIEEKKELLTEEEKEFLKSYIKIIECLNNGEVTCVSRLYTTITVYLRTGLTYDVDIGPRFKGITENKSYTLKELGLE